MRYIIFALVLLFMIGLFFLRRKERRKLQHFVGYEESHSFFQSQIFGWVRKKTEYTETSLYQLTLFSIIFMIPGGILGMFFKNMQLGFILSIGFASLPYIYLIMIERKKQKLILKEIIPFLTSLDWAYQSSSYSVPDALEQAGESCPYVIRKEYTQMMQKIHASMRPSLAMKEFAEQTHPVFSILAGILATQEQRNDVKAFRHALKELIRSIVKTNNRIAKVEATLKKKNIFLLSLLGTTIVIFWLSFSMMSDPLGYFRGTGAGGLVIGTIVMLIPVIIYFMSLLRRRF